MGVDDFRTMLARPSTSVAVVGATDSPGKYGGIIYRDLKAKGYRVFAVNPGRASVDGDLCYPDLSSLPEQPDIIDFVVPPDRGMEVSRQVIDLGWDHVWLQPGSESPELARTLNEAGISFIQDACIMVVARTSRQAR